MHHKNLLCFILAVSVTGTAFAQNQQTETSEDPQPIVIDIKTKNVSISSRGNDVRTVLYDLFTQTGENFIIDVGLPYSLHLNLQNVPFGSAIDLICQSAGLTYRVQDGIYIFSKAQSSKPIAKTVERVAGETLDAKMLSRKVNLNLEKVDLRTACAEMTRQTGVPIEIAQNVGSFRINALLTDTPLKSALQAITEPANLKYSLTNHGTVLISKNTDIKTSTTNSQQSVKLIIRCNHCNANLEKGWKYCPACGNYIKNITSL